MDRDAGTVRARLRVGNTLNKSSTATMGSLLPLDLWARLDRITARLPLRWAGWLAAEELLTERIAREAGGPAQLRLLEECIGFLNADQRELLGSPTDSALLRQVELTAQGRAWVYAETLIPDCALDAHPWLADLGVRALPEALSWRDDVRYGAWEVATLPAAHPLATRALQRVPGRHEAVWARRAVITIGEARVLLHEAFLPDSKSR